MNNVKNIKVVKIKIKINQIFHIFVLNLHTRPLAQNLHPGEKVKICEGC
jgi:hypothetical protein